MPDDTSIAIEVLRRAMALEQEGRRFYLKALENTQDAKGKQTFKTLSDDEQRHYDLLKSQYDALKENGNWVSTPEIRAASADLSHTLFPQGIDALKEKVTEKSSDWDAVLFGLDIEIKSYDLYRKTEVKDSIGKQVLAFLAEQEMGHFNLLMMRYESLFGPSAWQP